MDRVAFWWFRAQAELHQLGTDRIRVSTRPDAADTLIHCFAYLVIGPYESTQS